MGIRHVAASYAILALALSFSSQAWSQADENYVLSSNISDRFEAGEFGEPLGEARRQSVVQAALVSAPQPEYVYYVVPCGTPGAIRAGSPSALDAGARAPDVSSPAAESSPAEDVCVVLVDEKRSESAPLLYTYDSSYRYPSGYPNHHRASYQSGTYASSINVGYYSSRRYGAYGHGVYGYGAGHYGAAPFGLHPYSAYPYGGGAYRGGHFGATPFGAYGYGAYPYVSHHYSVRYGVGRYGAGRHARGLYGRGGFGPRYSHMHRSRLR